MRNVSTHAEKENETRKSALKMFFGGGAVLMCQDGVLMIKSSSFLNCFHGLVSDPILFLSCCSTEKEHNHFPSRSFFPCPQVKGYSLEAELSEWSLKSFHVNFSLLCFLHLEIFLTILIIPYPMHSIFQHSNVKCSKPAKCY